MINFIRKKNFFSIQVFFHEDSRFTDYLFNFPLPLSPATQTLRHQPGNYNRGLTFAHSLQPGSNQQTLVTESKLFIEQLFWKFHHTKSSVVKFLPNLKIPQQRCFSGIFLDVFRITFSQSLFHLCMYRMMHCQLEKGENGVLNHVF